MDKIKLNKKNFYLFLIFSTLIIFVFYTAIKNNHKVEAAETNQWSRDMILSQKGNYEFAGIYEFDNLKINDNVQVTSKGISHLVIKVNGTLTLGKNVSIRVRNGYYPEVPKNPISMITEQNYKSLGVDAGGFRVYENMFGKGGNGGDGPKVDLFEDNYSIPSGGGGGGGGFGGGNGGLTYNMAGDNGKANGGDGGDASSHLKGGTGGGALGVGDNGQYEKSFYYGGSGGGGNGGDGAGCYDAVHAGGGGGGGYGGGVLTIIAKKIVYNNESVPNFLTSGQLGGKGGDAGFNGDSKYDGKSGENGQGGLLILQCPNINYSANNWNIFRLSDSVYKDKKPLTTGHGSITGDPQKVIINGREVKMVKGIKIQESETVSYIGSPKTKIKTDIQPLDATCKDILWYSDNKNIAEVDKDGNITAKSPGTVTITAKAVDGGYTSTCKVVVKRAVQSIKLDKGEIKLLSNRDKINLIATIFPKDASNKNVKWSSSNPSIAEVDGNGLVTAKNPGTAVITVTSEDKGLTSKCNVKVEPVNITSFKLNRNTLILSTKSTPHELTPVFEPANATYKDIIWKVSDTSVISLNNGIVTPLKDGKTEITAMSKDKKFVDKCLVEVIKENKDNVFWHSNVILGPNNIDYPYAGIYNFKNLYIDDDVEVTSKGISQLVINVKGRLYIGKNSVIRVRNGYYPTSPHTFISDLTNMNINSDSISKNQGSFRLYENVFGKGGNGGKGGDGTIGTLYSIVYGVSGVNNGGDGGNGGGGGFGGGIGGTGGEGAKGMYYYSVVKKGGYTSLQGENGLSGMNYAGGNKDIGGIRLGEDGENGKYLGNGGFGGGGNGGNGGKIVGDVYRNSGKGFGGCGGGGGGYGGGVLSIIADNINLNPDNNPKFIVSGEKGGEGGKDYVALSGKNGEDGQGGLLVISSPNYKPSENNWNLNSDTFGKHDVNSNNGGHGIVTGNPQKIFINGSEYDPAARDSSGWLKGDFNNDNKITISDLAALSVDHGLTKKDKKFTDKKDLNKDGMIDIYDLVILSKKFN